MNSENIGVVVYMSLALGCGWFVGGMFAAPYAGALGAGVAMAAALYTHSRYRDRARRAVMLARSRERAEAKRDTPALARSAGEQAAPSDGAEEYARLLAGLGDNAAALASLSVPASGEETFVALWDRYQNAAPANPAREALSLAYELKRDILGVCMFVDFHKLPEDMRPASLDDEIDRLAGYGPEDIDTLVRNQVDTGRAGMLRSIETALRETNPRYATLKPLF